MADEYTEFKDLLNAKLSDDQKAKQGEWTLKPYTGEENAVYQLNYIQHYEEGLMQTTLYIGKFGYPDEAETGMFAVNTSPCMESGLPKKLHFYKKLSSQAANALNGYMKDGNYHKNLIEKSN